MFFALSLIHIFNITIRVVGLTWKRFRRSSWDLYSIPSVLGSSITTILSLILPHVTALLRLHKLFLVSMTLLLIPRNAQLDQLFKTAAASFTGIVNLMATWFVLFLVYAIALNQIFGLTKFGSNETTNLNFRTVPKSLILLFRMSCGEGWNSIMEDYATMKSPLCTYKTDFFKSDCGSAGWARGLLISWNIISMYIFVSLFVSLIFESFSYVYQHSNSLYTVSREDIRQFKRAWSIYDPDGTGLISTEIFPRLLAELSGVFEMRIYEGDFTVKRILETCKSTPDDPEPPLGPVIEGVDLGKLNRRLSHIDVREVRRRRKMLSLFSEEVYVTAGISKMVSFTSCLMLLAHYKIIVDNRSLK